MDHSALPEATSAVLAARHFEQLSNVETAQTRGISESARLQTLRLGGKGRVL